MQDDAVSARRAKWAATAQGLARRLSLAVTFAVLSCLIYGCTVLSLPQLRDARYCCEQNAVAVAVSNIMFGAPLGTAYSSAYDYFVKRQSAPLSGALDNLQTDAELPAAAGQIITMWDGNGVGYLLFVTAAFRLFGMPAWALPSTMWLLMSLSAVVFLWQFRSETYRSLLRGRLSADPLQLGNR